MPKSTFYNLPEKKKQRVIDAAIDEFATYNYYKANVTRIVDRANIAKGSFYQYFDDKKDLFKYIIELMSQEKLEYLGDVLKNKDNFSFFQLLEKLYISGINFARENPRLQAIGGKLYNNIDSPIFTEIIGTQKTKSNEFFQMLLKKGIEQREVDENINIKLVAHMLTTINISLGEFIYEDNQIDMDDMQIIREMLYVIENGIAKRRKEYVTT